MKQLFVIFALVSCATIHLLAQAPQLEILLIGASHSYDIPQDATDIHQKIMKFRPDAVFGEFLSPEDEKALTSYWNKENVSGRTKRLKAKRSISESELPKVIADLQQKTIKNPKDYKAKIDLAHAYYVNEDAGNGHYQLWQVAKELEQNPKNTELFEYAKLVLSPTLDSVHKVVKRYSLNEYDVVAYPVMQKLGHTQIYPMDCQKYDDLWSEAWGYSDSLAGLYKEQVLRNPTCAEALLFLAISKSNDDMLKAFEAMETTNPEHATKVTELMNTPYCDDFLMRMNIVNSDYLTLRNYPAAAFQEKLHWWMMRNITMCQNTIDRSKSNGFKKVVILVGAGHRLPMATLFGQMPDIKIWNINDYK